MREKRSIPTPGGRSHVAAGSYRFAPGCEGGVKRYEEVGKGTKVRTRFVAPGAGRVLGYEETRPARGAAKHRTAQHVKEPPRFHHRAGSGYGLSTPPQVTGGVPPAARRARNAAGGFAEVLANSLKIFSEFHFARAASSARQEGRAQEGAKTVDLARLRELVHGQHQPRQGRSSGLNCNPPPTS